MDREDATLQGAGRSGAGRGGESQRCSDQIVIGRRGEGLQNDLQIEAGREGENLQSGADKEGVVLVGAVQKRAQKISGGLVEVLMGDVLDQGIWGLARVVEGVEVMEELFLG